MKSVRNSLFLFSTVLLFSGCYTELATVEQNDREYVYDADTTFEEGSTTVNNHYYLDDSYRRSRLRASFHYYYPENNSWIGAYYNSYFNDPYWGMRPWSWAYDPWYGYYPATTWCYTPPYYDPWYPHYPYGGYYPVYYPNPVYVSTQPATPPRIRTEGSSRDGNRTDVRSRPIVTPSTETPVTTTRTRGGVDKEVVPSQTPVRTRGNDVSWWDRKDKEQPKEVRPVERPRTVRNPNVSEKQKRGNEEAVSTDRPREVRKPTVSPTTKPSTPKKESRPADRPRESRRQSYNPPPQQSSSSAPASSRGSSSSSTSSSSGSRKRN
ncbi:MAG: hypothetical protein Q8L88_14970 [Bacteroidota bacterium]|nr:hypothetical protein [Bacteroidota bacterium]